MNVNVDHYMVLGIPSGEEGGKLTEKEISKAYKLKALELHPDKRPDDPNAHDNFQKLQSSYAILKDEKARKLFDDLLKVKRQQRQRQVHHDSKRRKMMSDLERREHAANTSDPEVEARVEEERIARKLKEEIARIREMLANKGVVSKSAPKKARAGIGKETTGGSGGKGSLDKDKVLKVSWEKIGEDYNAERLMELFSKFGKVEDVVIKSSKKRGSALIVMAAKDAAVAATGNISGNLSNPLLVVPLHPAVPTEFPSTKNSSEPPQLNNLVGLGFQAFEDDVLAKLQKAAKSQK